MLIQSKSSILSSEITERTVFESRREFIKAATALSAGLMLPGLGHAETGKYTDALVGALFRKITGY